MNFGLFSFLKFLVVTVDVIVDVVVDVVVVVCPEQCIRGKIFLMNFDFFTF